MRSSSLNCSRPSGRAPERSCAPDRVCACRCISRPGSPLREHRVVYLGNAAQTLHPVAGQGLNLGMRDCAALADDVGQAQAEQRDLVTALGEYESARRVDRAAILA